jgi:hypothetical protein
MKEVVYGKKGKNCKSLMLKTQSEYVTQEVYYIDHSA